MIELTALGWAALAAAALLIGVAKTALPGAATIAVAVFAAVLPARESTAALLLLLIVGDLVAVWIYRRQVDIHVLLRLVPSVLVGLTLGALFLAYSNDLVMRRSIGIILLTLTGLTLYLMKKGTLSSDNALANPNIRGAYGVLGGFTSMAANAGGPVMTLYFVAARFDMMRFIATQAWFFFVINVVKVPFSIGLGLLKPEVLPALAILTPVVLIGAFAGRRWVRRFDQRTFTRVVIGLTVISSLYLLR